MLDVSYNKGLQLLSSSMITQIVAGLHVYISVCVVCSTLNVKIKSKIPQEYHQFWRVKVTL